MARGWIRGFRCVLVGKRGSQAELEFRFGGSEQCLVDLRVVRVESDIARLAVRVALKDDVIIGLELQKRSKLQYNTCC